MSEDSNDSSGEGSEPTPKPKVRRISNKAPRKIPGEVPENDSVEKESAKRLVDEESGAEAITAEKSDQKRSKRRRRGKKPSAHSVEQASEGVSSEPAESPAQEGSGRDSDSGKNDGDVQNSKPQGSQRPAQPPRRKPDPEKVAKNAWKIFLAEVSEEGVALIGDNDARELARRCFRLSEIFLEEADRRN